MVIYTSFNNSSPAAQNPCARFLLCCLKCCFWCLEKFIKFLNRNAYIMVSSAGQPVWPRSAPWEMFFVKWHGTFKALPLEDVSAYIGLYLCYCKFYFTSNNLLCTCQIAIYGKNFCVSAKNAFMLLMRNIIRFVLKVVWSSKILVTFSNAYLPTLVQLLCQ